MILNGKRLNENERMKLLADMEHEECETLSAEAHKALLQRPADETLHELEKLQAASLVMMARRIDEQLVRMDNLERAAFGNAARRLAAELLEAARKSDRYRPDDVPEWLVAS